MGEKRNEYNVYLNSLQECNGIAQNEYIRLEKNIEKIKRILEEFKKETNEFIKESKKLNKLEENELDVILENLNNKIVDNLDNEVERLECNSKKKKKNLENFTVTLFGRTKAGKSTLREALTNGDGASIGKGAQRTTRDIYEYNWNKLRIIDTPGIGAYEGEEDVEIAEGVIEESDLILFIVTSDSIQEAEFEKMMHLRLHNKPIVILLNVKQAIDKNIQMKRFLKSYKESVSKQGQEGNIMRIGEYCEKYLGNKNVDIIVMHAMSAYESTRVGDEILKSELYKASRINVLKLKLREVITQHGRQKRILTFRDDYINYLNLLEEILWVSYREIKVRKEYIDKKYGDVETWFKNFKLKSEKKIEKEVDKIYIELISEIDGFIDKYAGEKEISIKWNEELKKHKINEKINDVYKKLVEEAERYLNEFQRQMNFEVNNINFTKEFEEIKNAKKGNTGRILRWAGVALDGVFLISLTNWWNPAGWITGVIGIVGAGISIFSCAFGNDTSRYNKKKSKAKKRLENKLRSMQTDTVKELKEYNKKNLIDNLEKEISVKLFENKEKINTYLEKLKKKALDIRNEQDKENNLLFSEIYKITFNEKIKSKFIKVTRCQGKILKVMLMEDERLKCNDYRKILENIMGERIIYVEFINKLDELIKRCLYPGEVDNLDIEVKDRAIILKIKKENVENVIGEKGININLTNRLLDSFQIKLEEQ